MAAQAAAHAAAAELADAERAAREQLEKQKTKVFQVVRARAHWNADEDQRRAATAHAVATQQWQCATGPLRRLSQPDRGELDLGWALSQYELQEGACFYTRGSQHAECLRGLSEGAAH